MVRALAVSMFTSLVSACTPTATTPVPPAAPPTKNTEPVPAPRSPVAEAEPQARAPVAPTATPTTNTATEPAPRSPLEAAEPSPYRPTESQCELCVLPDPLPPSLDAACDRMSAAYDGFMIRLFPAANIQKTWSSARGQQLAMQRTVCAKIGSIEVAACQANAMERAEPKHRRQLPKLMRVCTERFGP